MHLLKAIFPIILFAVVAGCATASGPIKAYPQDELVDKSQLSVIYLPPEIELLEVDGMQTDTPFIEEGYNQVHIPPGHHQLAVKYVKFWGDASAGSMVASKPVIYSLEIAPKSEYYIKFEQPQDHWAAQAMANKFSPWVEDKHGVKLKTRQSRYAAKSLTSGSQAMTTEQPGEAKTPLDKLKFWWKQAGYKEKKAFEDWMDEN